MRDGTATLDYLVGYEDDEHQPADAALCCCTPNVLGLPDIHCPTHGLIPFCEKLLDRRPRR